MGRAALILGLFLAPVALFAAMIAADRAYGAPGRGWGYVVTVDLPRDKARLGLPVVRGPEDAARPLVVIDAGNHRALVWNQFPQSNSQPADLVLGQPDFTTSAQVTAPTASTVSSGMAAESPLAMRSTVSTPRTAPIRQGVHLPQDSMAQNSIAKR